MSPQYEKLHSNRVYTLVSDKVPCNMANLIKLHQTSYKLRTQSDHSQHDLQHHLVIYIFHSLDVQSFSETWGL